MLDALPLDEALARMADNYDAAMDKVLLRVTTEVHDGVARGELRTPTSPGSYRSKHKSAAPAKAKGEVRPRPSVRCRCWSSRLTMCREGSAGPTAW